MWDLYSTVKAKIGYLRIPLLVNGASKGKVPDGRFLPIGFRMRYGGYNGLISLI